MDKAKLIINSQDEFSLIGDLITIGRASGNDTALTEDSNISRYQAEIENRNGKFWLIDLGSSNGTNLNGEKVTTEKPFYDGDVIILGGSSKIEVLQIQLDLQNGDCVKKAFFMLDGKEFASAENQPFTATINPAQLALSRPLSELYKTYMR